MMKISDLVGNTPLIELRRICPNPRVRLLAKMESHNPGGSVKDRPALSMIEGAEARGELRPGVRLIEPTSGNTGIGLALVCSVKKYRLILVMPENYSVERRYLMREMGAEIVLTKAEDEMPGAIAKVEELSRANPDCFLPRQFSNPDNPEAHRKTTAPEILREIPAERIDAFVVGVGTGGTLTGVGSVLKAQNPRCLVVAVEPEQAAVLSGKKPRVHQIQGIGPGFIPDILDRSLIDRIETVRDAEAYEASKYLARREGLLMGISSGAAYVAALRLAKELGPGKKVVTVFPDKGERYFSIEKYFKNETKELS